MNELERVEASALRDALTRGGGRAETVGGAVCVMHPRADAMELNRAFPLTGAVDVRAIRAWFGGGTHAVVTPPGHRLLRWRLRRAGYTSSGAWVKFERGDAPAPEAQSSLRVEETADADAFALVTSAGSGMPLPIAHEMSGVVGAPGWRCFLAWAGSEPAAAGALYSDGSTAWLGVASTRPEYRGRGAQSAILAARIEAGRSDGVRVFASETGEQQGPSYRNLLRAGFRPVYRRPNWRSPA